MKMSREKHTKEHEMKRIKSILKYTGLAIVTLIVILFLSIPFSHFSVFNPDIPSRNGLDLVIQNVSIFTGMDANFLPNQTIVIENGLIKKIKPFNPNETYTDLVVDGEGLFAIPGLIDMHAHIFDRTDLALYLANGITTVRNMMGFPMHLRWQEQSKDPLFPGSRLISASPTLNGGDFIPFHVMVEDPEEARELVRQFKSEGYQLIKIYDGLSKEVFTAIMEEAALVDIPVAGHAPKSVSFDDLLEKGPVSLEHVEELYQGPLNFKKDEESMRALAKKIKAAGVYVTPTRIAFYNIYRAAVEKQAFLDSVPVEWLTPLTLFFGKRALAEVVKDPDNEWIIKKDQTLQTLLKILHEENVKIIMGTDTGPAMTVPGLAYHQEIALLAEAGFTPVEIIWAGTTESAQVLGRVNELGVIKVGAIADIVLVETNPLENLRSLQNPRAVIKKGHLFDHEALKALRGAAKNKISIYTTVGQILEHMLTY